MEKDKLDKLFADKLQDHELTPGVNAWNAIEQSLDKKKKNIWPLIGIAASAVLAVISSWYLITATEDPTQVEYSYAQQDQSNLDVPASVIYVPIFIHVPSTPIEINDIDKVNQTQLVADSKPANNLEQINPNKHKLAKDMSLNSGLSPVIREPLPILVEDPEEIIIASAKDDIVAGSINTPKPLTIIYKQGTPEPKSKFTQAVNYMEEVRIGNKKLINFKKLRENIQSKLSSNKEVNSK
jgi:hypothetical protein